MPPPSGLLDIPPQSRLLDITPPSGFIRHSPLHSPSGILDIPPPSGFIRHSPLHSPSGILDIPPPSGLVYWIVPTEASLLDIPSSTCFATFLDVYESSMGLIVVFS